jgi:hypothetical protein
MSLLDAVAVICAAVAMALIISLAVLICRTL